MHEQVQALRARRRRSASITLVLIASSAMTAGCDQRVSAGDVAYRDAYRNLDDCRRDYGDDCTQTPGSAGFHGPYLVRIGSRPVPAPHALGVEQTVLNADTASRINSGLAASRGGATLRGGFGGSGEGGGGEGGAGE